MIPDVPIHDPWPKDGEAAEEHMAIASHSEKHGSQHELLWMA